VFGVVFCRLLAEALRSYRCFGVSTRRRGRKRNAAEQCKNWLHYLHFFGFGSDTSKAC
jgi:hypothetical protein